MGCSPSGTGCSSVGPHGVTRSASKRAPAWAPLSTGPQSWQSLLQRGLSTGHSLLWASTCSGVGSLPQATCEYLLHHGPPWAAGNQPASPWFSPQVAGRLEYLLPLHLPLTLVSPELFLSRILTPLSSHGCQGFFFPFALTMLSQRCYHHC